MQDKKSKDNERRRIKYNYLRVTNPEKLREIWRRKYYSLKKRNPDKLRENGRRKYLRIIKNPDFLEKEKRRMKTAHYRFMSYRRNAKSINVPFGLDEKFFAENMNRNCFYCNDKIDGIGIDRIDSNCGYELNNIVICCRRCNWSKNKYGVNDFIDMCKKVCKNFTNQ